MCIIPLNTKFVIYGEIVKKELKLYLDEVKALHDKDIKAGYGEVYLPDALERKYSDTPKGWGWQYVFPSGRLSVDPRSVETTMIYTHVVRDMANAPKSPLDKLYLAV